MSPTRARSEGLEIPLNSKPSNLRETPTTHVSNTYIAAHIIEVTFSTIGSNQKRGSNCFFNFFSIFVLDDSRDDTFAILLDVDKLGIQLNKDPVFLDVGSDDLFGMVLTK